jgi:alpha-mannosidase
VLGASITNLLEDEVERLELLEVMDTPKDGEACEIKLDFRGFEVKTVKLTLGMKSKRESGGWVKV